MFVLAELKDKVRIAPEQFDMKLPDAVTDEINRKLANKVLLDVGLCIALREIVSIGDSIILPGDGACHTEVVFRYIVFRPSIGDVITGKIKNCNREGVHITLGFFADILIPPTALQHPSRFEEAEQAWVWEYPVEGGDKHDLFMDEGESIKFRVTGEVFQDISPVGPPGEQPSTSAQQEYKAPYKIIAAINESGLGLLSWWDSHNQGEEEEADEEGVEDGDPNEEENVEEE